MFRIFFISACLGQLVISYDAVKIKDISPSIKNAGPPVKVTTPSGTYLGRKIKTIGEGGLEHNAFLGIPYAEAPVGDLRFKKTVALGKLVDEYEAVEQRPFCIQINPFTHLGDGEEDCLYLNVYTPVQSHDGLLKKVFVYIHGGGNINGMKDIYNPGTLVSQHDIIVVAMNYRVGILGFLASNTDSAPGNFGLWDQLEALRWINKNIEAFGGDPAAVTVGGESAGGFYTSALTMSAYSRGLFIRAFPMSGVLGGKRAWINHDPVSLASLVAKRENCSHIVDDKPPSNEDWSVIVECLRTIPADRFASMEGLGAAPNIGPVIDGDYFPKPLDELLSDATYLESFGFHNRDYLVSVCYNEGDVFTAFQDITKANMTQEQIDALPSPEVMLQGFMGQFLSYMFGPLSPEALTKVVNWYQENYEINPLADFAADFYFHIPTLEYVNAAAHGWKEGANKIWLLRFAHFPEFMTGPYKGTVHGIDLAYLFDFDLYLINKVIDYKADPSKWNDEDEKLKKKYTALVASFIKNGTPLVGPGTETTGLDWPAYTSKDGHYLHFNNKPDVLQHLKADRVKLFDELIPAWMKEFPYTEATTSDSKHASDEL